MNNIREALNEILLEYPIDIAEDLKTYKVLLDELETYINKVREEAVRGFVEWANSEDELLDDRYFIPYECAESYLQSIKDNK